MSHLDSSMLNNGPWLASSQWTTLTGRGGVGNEPGKGGALHCLAQVGDAKLWGQRGSVYGSV